MAEFRKLFYAFGLAALLAGASSTASAQTTTICNSNAGVPPIIRAESFADLVGDYVLDCTGGTPTVSGAVVPAVNFTVTLSTQITSKLLGGTFSEALLIIDEPNSAARPARPLLACGATSAPDNTASGPGVCPITSNGDPTATYDGAAGRPNVFQGRTGVAQNANDSNIIVFNGIPFDPPGLQDDGVTPAHRYLRFTNFRANAPLVSSSFLLQTVVMNVNVNGSTAIAINNPSQVVASVQRGLQAVTVTGQFGFVQCLDPDDETMPTIRFREGFASSFKTKGFEQILNNGIFSAGYWRLDPTVDTVAEVDYSTTPVRQNVPGAIYNTESGFTAHPTTQSTPSPNPPLGIGSTPVTGSPDVLTDGFTTSPNVNTNIQNAGIATQGTRLAVTLRDVPAGSTVSLPLIANLVRSDNNAVVTGLAVRVITDQRGAGAYTPATSGTVGSDNLAVYEVVFADPFVQEDLLLVATVDYTPNLASNQPDPTKTAQAAGGFAPFILATDSVTAWSTASSTLPVPRFRSTGVFADLYRVNKCACNLLFPFVSNAATPNGNYDTGIAIANTSATPGSTFGFFGQAQEGAVQFWYYPALSTSSAVPTQCTNTTSPGTCPGTKVVKAGETLTYILSQGSTTWGLDNRGAGFTGYMIAQTQFQYCHAFAYISPQGALPLTNGMSVGYLGLILDKGSDLPRTLQQRDALDQ